MVTVFRKGKLQGPEVRVPVCTGPAGRARGRAEGVSGRLLGDRGREPVGADMGLVQVLGVHGCHPGLAAAGRI